MFSNCFSAVRKGCRGRRSLVVVLAIPLLILGVILVQRSFYRSNPEKDRLPTAAVADNSLGNPAPPPFPYQELTIPFLRNRDFKSSLGALEIQAENSSYTAYLTSYDSDGLRVSGLLTIPRGEEPEDGWPAVVFVHGYIPPSDYQTTQNYIAYVDYLARSGLVVFKIDLRGHGESEGEPGGGYYSSDYIIDTLNAYRALQSADFVNPERVGLWGHSMAGNVVFRSLVVEEDIPAVVIWAGAVYTYRDFSEYRISDDSYRPPAGDSERRRYRESLMETYGEFDPESPDFRKIG